MTKRLISIPAVGKGNKYFNLLWFTSQILGKMSEGYQSSRSLKPRQLGIFNLKFVSHPSKFASNPFHLITHWFPKQELCACLGITEKKLYYILDYFF